MDGWSNWTKWEKKFLWWPKKIKNKWYWLRFIYERERLLLWYSQKYEYDYAFVEDDKRVRIVYFR